MRLSARAWRLATGWPLLSPKAGRRHAAEPASGELGRHGQSCAWRPRNRGAARARRRYIPQNLSIRAGHVSVADWSCVILARHDCSAGAPALPMQDLVRELVIAHAQPGLHKVYDQYAYLDEKREALELWAARLRSIVELLPDNVIRIDRGAAVS